MTERVPPSPQDELQQKVEQWLATEGHPLEFQTASVFFRHKHRVIQSYFVSTADGVDKEVDVLAHRDLSRSQPLVRIAHVVECKWSRQKPWVLFTSQHARVAAPACIIRTVSSNIGHIVLDAIANDARAHATSFFATPRRPGFSGRQALGDRRDLFYKAVQSVCTSALAEAEVYRADAPYQSPPLGMALVFPLIVVDGHIFEAFFDDAAGEVNVAPVRHARLHWRGAPAPMPFMSVDVVTADDLDAFVAMRAAESEVLLPILHEVFTHVVEAFRSKSPAPVLQYFGTRDPARWPFLLRSLAGDVGL